MCRVHRHILMRQPMTSECMCLCECSNGSVCSRRAECSSRSARSARASRPAPVRPRSGGNSSSSRRRRTRSTPSACCARLRARRAWARGRARRPRAKWPPSRPRAPQRRAAHPVRRGRLQFSSVPFRPVPFSSVRSASDQNSAPLFVLVVVPYSSGGVLVLPVAIPLHSCTYCTVFALIHFSRSGAGAGELSLVSAHNSYKCTVQCRNAIRLIESPILYCTVRVQVSTRNTLLLLLLVLYVLYYSVKK